MKIGLFVYILFLMSCHNTTQENTQAETHSVVRSTSNNLKIVNWNIEWFGSSENGPKNKDLQEKNVLKILNSLDADIYALCEIVDTARFGHMIRTMNDAYDYYISDYASNAKDNRSDAWRRGQKMAFVVHHSLMKSIQVNGYLRNNSRLGYDLANGRYPYLLQAALNTNSSFNSLNVMILHGKSGSDYNSYNRRKEASSILSSNIVNDFAGKPFIILGDFNDELDGSIVSGNQTSPYSSFNTEDFSLLTKGLSDASTIHFNTVIDQQIINKTLLPYYINGSTKIYREVENIIPGYKNGNVSDHYPVVSYFSYSGQKTSDINSDNSTVSNLDKDIVDIESTNITNEIKIQSKQSLHNIHFVMKNQNENIVLDFYKKSLSPEKVFYLKCKELKSGNYSLIVNAQSQTQVIPFSKR